MSVALRHDKIHATDCEECETKEGKIDRIEREMTLEGELVGRAAQEAARDRRQVPGAPHAHLRDQHQDQGAGGRMSIVIVGAGQAAAQLVLSLRQGGCKDAIRMIGDEPYAPYQRPPLSKKFLTERPAAETLYFRPENFWREQGVTADYGVPVTAIDRTARRVACRGRAGRLRDAVPVDRHAGARDPVAWASTLPACSRCAGSTTCAACAARSMRRSAS